MRAYLLLPALLFLACSPRVAPVIDDDGTDWNARAASYADDPAALREFVRECEQTSEELTSLQRRAATYENQRGGMEQRIATAEAATEEARRETETLRRRLVIAEEAAARPAEELITDPAQPSEGVVFRVQLGAYASNRMNEEMATGDALDLSEQNGLQKVVVSRFRSYRSAAALRDRLREMGVEDAFIVATNNGERVEVAEALRLSGQN